MINPSYTINIKYLQNISLSKSEGFNVERKTENVYILLSCFGVILVAKEKENTLF